MAESALAILDRDFRGHRVVLSAPPTRFQVNLTEACNLRCAHCITDAPARTEAGTARTMSTEVLEALGPHLAHASYLGLTHAGEPTIAPLFEPLLARLQLERRGAPTVVHVLSNGQTINPERFSTWTRMGVRSWSFSLDGLRPETHDQLRLGSRIEVLLGRIRGLLGRRQSEQLRTRIGLAFTVTAENVGELLALVELAAELGVDWLKLEETVPVNPRAARLATIEAQQLAGALGGARHLAQARGLRLLDHTRAPEVWKCRLDQDPAMAEWSLLDDYVNHAELNPCRLPSELLCIEPNGDVRPLDFHQPVLGNLLKSDLADLWRSPPLVMARSRRIDGRLCGPGPVRCASDPGPTAELTPVRFQFQGLPGQPVELLGDFPTWKVPHPMLEESPGQYGVTLALAPGVYRYKFRVEQRHWHADPTAPTDTAEGFGNSLRIVGGPGGPLTFAPDGAHRRRQGDRLWLHAETEVEGEFECFTAADRVPFVTVIQRGPRRLLAAEARLGGDGRYALARPGSPPFATFDAPAEAPSGPPAWAERAVYYGIFVDRWHRGRDSAPDPRALGREQPSSAATYYGGDLAGIRAWVPELAALGVDALLLSPIHSSESAHRYDAVDLTRVDPRLGGERALAALTETAHEHGLKVVLDAAFTHVSAAHPAFRSLLREQARSAHASWFRVRRWPVLLGDLESYEGYAQQAHLPRLMVESPAVEDHLVEVGARLVELGADGFRLDAMDEAPSSFWRRFRARLRARNPELVFLGEVVHDRPALHLDAGADQVTDFPRQAILLEALARGRMDAAGLWSALRFGAHRAGPYPASAFVGFLDNHDTARFRSVAIEHDRLRLALSFLLAWPGPAALSYGTELGLAGGGHDGDRDHVWCERLPMPGRDALATRSRALLRRLLVLRREFLRDPEVRLVLAEGSLLILGRGPLLLLHNLSIRPATLPPLPQAELLLDTHGAIRAEAPLAGLGARWLRPFLASRPG